MENNIKVEINSKTLEFKIGTSLLEILEVIGMKDDFTIVAAKVNNDLKELGYVLTEDSKVELISLDKDDGTRIYRRSLHFILIKAFRDLMPEKKLIISYSISKGMYIQLEDDEGVSIEELDAIEKKMKEIIAACLPFERVIMGIDEAKRLCYLSGREDRALAFEHRNKQNVTMYRCGDLYDYFYGYMVPHTGYVKSFKLINKAPGFILLFPEKRMGFTLPIYTEQPKLFNVFKEYKKWLKILEIENVGALNNIVKDGKISELIRVAEALQEKKFANIVDQITLSKDKKKIILIAGPSSSGKTTSANRLGVQLKVSGLKPVTISLDNYFINRDTTPKDESGEFDFEALEALDVELFNDNLGELIKGREVELPIYNFKLGKRESKGTKRKLGESDVLVIEGIHGLNDKLTASIPEESKFKIFVSALTSLNLDDHNRIPTTDTRVIRRIVRDHQFRGANALSTIKRWSSVRKGEEKNIFPFQENADVFFNSSLVYELGVLKTLAEPLLQEIDQSNEEYSEAKRLLEFLSYFLPIDYKEIPFNSIIREFVGGSCFYT